MQLDVDIEPTFKFAYCKISNRTAGLILRVISYNLFAQTDRQKVTHKSPPCNLHRWAQN